MRKVSWMSIIALLATIFTFTPAHAAPLYTFTNASSTGINGPTQAQVTSAYTGTPLAGLVTINTRGIQEWTVPATGEYWLEFAGASGGYTPNALGGKGRSIKVKINLTAGHLLRILVGQEGGRQEFTTGYAGGGGGGTYVYNSTTSSYIGVAGGGGGAAQGNSSYVSTQPGVDASAYNSTAGASGTGYSGSYGSPGAGGTNGSAGVADGGAAGAGINANGGNGGYGGFGGTRFLAGGAGGSNGKSGSVIPTLEVPGGFGGGAGSSIYNPYEAIGGGGGGYSGGGSGATRIGAGGGGGNFFTGTYVSNGLNTGHGFVKIQLAVPPTVELSLSAGSSTASKGVNTTISAVIDDAGLVTFFADNRQIPGCRRISASVGTVNCAWKPAVQKVVILRADLSQSGSVVASKSLAVKVQKRSNIR